MDQIKAIIISSVVPPLIVPLCHMCERYFELTPMVVGPGIKSGISLRYDNPREVGADRIVNAVAAFDKYSKKGMPMIIVDFGTATTFCALLPTGEYLGGAIAPVSVFLRRLCSRERQNCRVSSLSNLKTLSRAIL